MDKLSELYDLLAALNLPESLEYSLRLKAAELDTASFSKGYRAGIAASNPPDQQYNNSAAESCENI